MIENSLNDTNEQELLKIFKSLFTVPEERIKFLKRGELEWDSLRHAQLILKIQKNFSFKFTLDEIEESDSFLKILSVLNSRVNRPS